MLEADTMVQEVEILDVVDIKTQEVETMVEAAFKVQGAEILMVVVEDLEALVVEIMVVEVGIHHVVEIVVDIHHHEVGILVVSVLVMFLVALEAETNFLVEVVASKVQEAETLVVAIAVLAAEMWEVIEEDRLVDAIPVAIAEVAEAVICEAASVVVQEAETVVVFEAVQEAVIEVVSVVVQEDVIVVVIALGVEIEVVIEEDIMAIVVVRQSTEIMTRNKKLKKKKLTNSKMILSVKWLLLRQLVKLINLMVNLL